MLSKKNKQNVVHIPSLESQYKRNIHFFLETSHGDHRHIKQITNAFTVSQIEEVIFLTWRRTQSHQWPKD